MSSSERCSVSGKMKNIVINLKVPEKKTSVSRGKSHNSFSDWFFQIFYWIKHTRSNWWFRRIKRHRPLLTKPQYCSKFLLPQLQVHIEWPAWARTKMNAIWIHTKLIKIKRNSLPTTKNRKTQQISIKKITSMKKLLRGSMMELLLILNWSKIAWQKEVPQPNSHSFRHFSECDHNSMPMLLWTTSNPVGKIHGRKYLVQS